MRINALLILFLLFAPRLGVSETSSNGGDANLYSSFGKRDPFKVPDRGGLANGIVVDPVRKYRLEGYKLRAILRIAGRPQAMFEDPDGKSHVVREGDRIGMEGARISRIVNSEVIVTERSANYLGKETLLEKVISLPAETSPGTSEKGPATVNQQTFSDGGGRSPSGAAAAGSAPAGGGATPAAPVATPAPPASNPAPALDSANSAPSSGMPMMGNGIISGGTSGN